MSKEQIMPINHEINTPQRSKAEIQQSSINNFISIKNGQTEINQIIMSAIQKGIEKAKQSKK